MSAEILFHLRPDVLSLPEIHIIGVSHGVPGIMTLPRADSAYIRKIVRQSGGDLLAEGLTDQLLSPNGLFPKRLEPSWMKDTKALKNVIMKRDEHFGQGSHSWSKGNILSNLASIALRFVKRSAATFYLRAWGTFRNPRIETEPYSEREELSRLEDGARYSGIMFSDHVTALTVRSFFMASKLIAHCKKSRRPAVASCGAMHAGQILRFLEDPEKALAFLDRLRGQKTGEFGHLLDGFEEEHFSAAEKEFRWLLKKAEARKIS